MRPITGLKTAAPARIRNIRALAGVNPKVSVRSQLQGIIAWKTKLAAYPQADPNFQKMETLYCAHRSFSLSHCTRGTQPASLNLVRPTHHSPQARAAVAGEPVFIAYRELAGFRRAVYPQADRYRTKPDTSSSPEFFCPAKSCRS